MTDPTAPAGNADHDDALAKLHQSLCIIQIYVGIAQARIAKLDGGQDLTFDAAIEASCGPFRALADAQVEPASTPIQTRFEPALTPAEHRRQHRPGRLSKIDSNPELRTFIIERIDTSTFPQLTEQVKAHFPKALHVSRSTIHRWWQHNDPRHLRK